MKTFLSGFAIALALAASPALAERIAASALPEAPSNAAMPAGPRLYLGDPAMPHLVDGRVHVVGAERMRYLGLLGAGYAGLLQLSRDGQHLYVATTYHSRLQRGTRSDVVEVYRAADLGYEYEIEIPPKRVQGLQIRALTAVSADDRFFFVQNSTPATSVSIVDLAARKSVAEVETPGCWGILPWPNNARRFSTVCGDGTTTTYTVDESGRVAATVAGAAFFDPDADPVFMHFEPAGDGFLFVSFRGFVHRLRTGAQALEPDGKPWPVVDAAAAKAKWRPGGFQLFALDPSGTRLVLAMHDQGGEGSHKNPAKELWVVDLAKRQRVARIPGQAALSMSFGPAVTSGAGNAGGTGAAGATGTTGTALYVLSAADNRILRYDVREARLAAQPALRSEPVGETPVYLVPR
ncbi:MAG: amine dehydrogenase large subunit [Rubrivivax sp.]